jgi:hypothetical protein
MPSCFWQLCHCPDQQPCLEHAGFFCGRWNGQVVDTVTRDAELSIVRLTADSADLDRIRIQLDARRAALEAEAREIERGLNQPGTFDERRALVSKMFGTANRNASLNAEIAQALADLSAINQRAMTAGGLIATHLVVPYTSPAGYCACYAAKQAQLASVIEAANREQANVLTPLVTQLGVLSGQIMTLFSGGNVSRIGLLLGGLKAAAALAAFILIGVKVSFLLSFLALLLFAIFLLYLIVQAVTLQIRIAQSRARIVKLHLAYYRIQEISTCQRALVPPPAAPLLPPSFQLENAWWRRLIEEVGPPAPPPEDE